MDKKKVMLYGVVSSILLLISALVPHIKVTIKNDYGKIISSYGMNFLSFYTIIPFVFIGVILIIAIRNYKIIKNNLEKNISNPFWLIIFMVFIAMGIIGMVFNIGSIDYAVHSGGDWPSFTKSIGYYFFWLALIGELIYVAIIFKINYKEKKLKENFIKFLDILRWIILIIIVILMLFVIYEIIVYSI